MTAGKFITKPYIQILATISTGGSDISARKLMLQNSGPYICLAMATIYFAHITQATNTEVTWVQQFSLLGVLMLTSKSDRGITGSGFVVLAATIHTFEIVPAAGLALVFGFDSFMSLGRALFNLAGNSVAALIVAKWSGNLDEEKMQLLLNNPFYDHYVPKQSLTTDELVP